MKKKMETSKRIILTSYIAAFLFSLIVVIGTFTGFEVSNITTIASLAWAEVAVSNAFYFRKAARENVPKVIASMPDDLKEQIDINQLLMNE